MFHVVRIQFWGQHRGYEIWYNNRPVLTLHDDLRLKRHEVYPYARQLNGG